MDLFVPLKSDENKPKPGEKRPERRNRETFCSNASFHSLFKFLNTFGSEAVVKRVVSLLRTNVMPLELQFMTEQFFKLDRFSQHAVDFYLQTLQLMPEKVRWEDVLAYALYNDQFFLQVFEQKRLENFIAMVVAGLGKDHLGELIVRMGFVRKCEVFAFEPYPALEQGLKQAFEAVLERDYLEQGLTSINALLAVHQLMQARKLNTPKMLANIILKVSATKQPNLELLLGLLKELMVARSALNPKLRSAATRELYLKKVVSTQQIKHELQKCGLSVEENALVKHGAAPLFSPEIEAYFFLTNLGSTTLDNAEDALARQAATSVFESLVGSKLVVILDVWDLENPDSELDLPALIADIRQRREQQEPTSSPN